MERINPMEKKLFDYDAYMALVDVLGRTIKSEDAGNAENARDDLDFLDKAMLSFFNYVNTVDSGELTIMIAKYREESEMFREVAESADRSRSFAHEAAIANATIINRMAKTYGISNVFLGNNKDRYEVADFCLDVATQVFANRKL